MEYRPITADEVKDVARLMRLGFGDSVALTEHYAGLIGINGYRGLFDRDRMIACIAVFADAHRFGTGSVSTWGVSCVGVDPGTRGRGISGLLLDEAINEAAAAGPAMMTLYASAPAAYRKMGFERAGKTFAYKAKTAQMAPSGSPSGTFRAIDWKAPEARTLLASIRSHWLPQTSGPLERGDAAWQFVLRPYDRLTDVFVWHNDAREPGGYAILHQKESSFEVGDLCAPTHDAAVSMLGFLGGFRAIYGDLTWNGAPVDPLILAMNDRWWETVRHEHWFCRIVDASKALAERGYAKGVAGRLSLTVDDPILAQNNGTLAIEIADTKASVRTVGDAAGSLCLTVQNLVPLFTGLVSASRLAAMGRLTGPQEAIEFADLAFSGPLPWMEDSF